MITLLKLGGSLITDKNRPHTAQKEIIRRLADEIREVWEERKEPLVIGHGSGSFGHVPARKYGTRDSVKTKKEWAGFAEVHAEATILNRIVTDILREAGLPVLSFVPMDEVRTSDGKVITWDTGTLLKSMDNHLIPLVFGDTVFDTIRGGTILSTEDLFLHLCETLPTPPRVLLAGLEEGVWRDFPRNQDLIREIHALDSDEDNFILGSASTDVTGGMHEKVRLMKEIVRKGKAHSAVIFSGMKPGNLEMAIRGNRVGTSVIL